MELPKLFLSALFIACPEVILQRNIKVTAKMPANNLIL
jgi:hypothetical protein